MAQDSFLDRLRGLNASQTAPVKRPQAKQVNVEGVLPDLNDQSCASNPMLRKARTTITYENKKTPETHAFLDSQAVQKITGISAVQLNGARLRVDFSSQGRFEEFQGPIVNVIEKTQYEARPGTALIAHTLTLGIGLLLAPVNSVQHAVGCTDSRVVRREVALQESVLTGNSQWATTESTHVLRIEGLGEVMEFNIRHDGSLAQKTFELDLLPTVMRAMVDKPLDLTITCSSCNADEAATTAMSASLQNKSILRADFTEVRVAELQRLERVANEERAARQRMLEMQQAILMFKRSIVGRWALPEVCLSGKDPSVGQVFELDGENRLSMVLRVADGAARAADRIWAKDVQVRPVSSNNQSWEIKMNLAGPGVGSRPLERVTVVQLQDENLQVIEQRDGASVTVRGGQVLSTGRQMLQYANCAHPKVLAQRAQLESEERERIRRAQAAAEEQRQKFEREQAQKLQRQKERERLYKL